MFRTIDLAGVKPQVAGAILLSSALTLAAQQAQQPVTAPAPIPAQIITAKKVFISNGGDQCNPFGQKAFSGGPNRSYDQFYGALKTWGHYQLADAPADADLVFEINFTCPIFFDEKVTRADPQFRLLVLDPKTRILLWAFTEHVPMGVLKGNRDKNFDQSMTNLVDSIKRLLLMK